MSAEKLRKMSLTVLTLSGVLFVCSAIAGESAQPAHVNVPASFQAQLDRVDAGLDRMKELTALRAQSTTVAGADLDSLPGPTENIYTGEIKRAVDSAFSAAELYANSEGQKGNLEELKALERVAQNHIVQFEQLKETANRYLADLKSGKILLAPDALKGRSQSELQEFRSFLLPDAVGLYPELRALDQHGSLDRSSDVDFADLGGGAPAGPTATNCYYAIACYTVCASGNFVACLNCIVHASAALYNYYFTTFLPCYNNLKGKPWYIPAWLWRVHCVANLLVLVA
jgi:hypothetical protein